ncbi:MULTISPECIES: NmrA family NAD(P)-binding protein [unclassified Pseudomonas]|uniref:NmrA family NAD(P)-binding protein n=1 Tax=unclassified Pseudomonas TaxID=196821 RepID=UPI002449F3F7|nr:MULTISPECIES: NmrA family NAD(P)-binding protein [unclassified Pseudomonas]MDH0893248.1 NmrA family NAD(P)-binding protein [Pseudomonas sp. GD03875]MDH1064246.1 NmrA family NAD(P)-binding protein [Pseudomonas sp. GD03985]
MRKTVTLYGATGVAGSACVEEMLEQDLFEVQVLLRQGQDRDRSTLGGRAEADKQALYARWRERGVRLIEADIASHASLIPALRGTDYLVSCAPYAATESQYALIYAAREAGVERFVPSEFGFIYEWEQFWPSDTEHRAMARQKAFIRRVIELAGLDYTIIPAGLWPEYYLLEPVAVMGDGNARMAWSTGRDVGRIIPHVLAHPASRNAVCPVAATAYCSWNELLDMRERLLGRQVERHYLDAAQWQAAYAAQPPGPLKTVMAIGVAATECPEGMPLWANWNALHLPQFQGTPLEQLFPDYIEPFVAAMQANLKT